MRAIKIAMVSALLMFLLTICFGTLYFKSWSDKKLDEYEKQHQASFAKYFDTFLEDHKKLESLNLFKSNTAQKNASTYLNNRLEWDGDEKLLQEFQTKYPTDKPLIKASPETEKIFSEWKDDWIRHYTELDYSKYDLQWMHDLLEYDYWELEEASPIVMMKPYIWYSSPFPYMVNFISLVKLRLMKGINDKNLLPALEEAQHLAELCYSTETLVGALIASNLLNQERLAYEYYSSLEDVEKIEWKALSAEEIERLARMIWAFAGMSRLMTPEEYSSKAFSTDFARIGKCAAIKEGLVAALNLRKAFEGMFPEKFKEFDNILNSAKNECRLTRLRNFWSQYPDIENDFFLDSKKEFCLSCFEQQKDKKKLLTAPCHFSSVPYLTDSYLKLLLLSMEPYWFTKYNQL